jgi:hypothetical protein
LRKLASSESKKGFSFIALLTRKWEIAQRIFRDEGVITLFVEVFCQICKPAVWLYDSIRLRWYRAIGMKSVTVLGNQIAVLPKDPGISRELALYKVHEPLATRLLMQTLEPGMNVVDIGSNIGWLVRRAASLPSSRCRKITNSFAETFRTMDTGRSRPYSWPSVIETVRLPCIFRGNQTIIPYTAIHQQEARSRCRFARWIRFSINITSPLWT